MSRYDKKYEPLHDINVDAFQPGKEPDPSYRLTNEDKKTRKDADMWSLIGDIAPLAGGAIGGIGGAFLGGPVGAAAGGVIGGGLGSAIGAGLHGQSDAETAGINDRAANQELKRLDQEQKRQDQDARRRDMLDFLMSARR